MSGMLLVILTGAADLHGQELQVGLSEVIITPPLSASMAGYYFDRQADGVHDELKAKAILFEQDGQIGGLVACDLLAIHRDVVDRAKAMIHERTGIAPHLIMIYATHAHTGPKFDDAYVDWLIERISDAVQMAKGKMSSARLSFGVGREERLPFHRRFWMKDGTLRTNPGKLNPDIVRVAGGVDPSVPIVKVSDAQGRPRSYLVNFAIHLDTIGGTMISADFPYYLADMLNRMYGPGMVNLFAMGASGNVNHWDVFDNDPQRSFAEAERIATRLAGEVIKMNTLLQPVLTSPINGILEDLTLPLQQFSKAEQQRAAEILNAPNPTDVDFVLERVWAYKVQDIVDRGTTQHSIPIQVFQVGEIAFVGLPGEPFNELALQIKQRSPFENTVVVTLANGTEGYIAREEDYPNGGYEVVSSRFKPGCGERMVAKALDLLRRL